MLYSRQQGVIAMEYLKYDNATISYDKVTNRRKFTKIHYHDSNELYYLLSGRTKYFVGDETFVLEKRNLIFIPSQVLHSCDSEDTLHNERIVVNIPDSYFDESTKEIFEDLKNSKFIYIPPEKLYAIDDLFNKINTEYSKEKQHSSILIKLYILELLTLLCRLKTHYDPISVQTDEIVREVAEYIRHNYSENLSLELLSKKFCLSGSYLSRQFKVVLGIGLGDFITYIRITNAEKLLSETDMSVTEVAANCGYNDSNYFAAVFKRLKGTTPYKYKKLFLKP